MKEDRYDLTDCGRCALSIGLLCSASLFFANTRLFWFALCSVKLNLWQRCHWAASEVPAAASGLRPRLRLLGKAWWFLQD